jgi:hypothetical protein
MEKIKINNYELILNPLIEQKSSKGRPIKYTGIRSDLTKSPKYINNIYRHCTYYFFKYLDIETENHFGFYFNEQGKFEYIINNEEFKKLHQL